jgi:hypothetical protein
MTNPSELAREIQHLRQGIERQFREGEWAALTGGLRTVAALAEAQGSMALCLRAQALRELLGLESAGGRGREPGPRLAQLFHDLLAQLAHLEWVIYSGGEAPQELWDDATGVPGSTGAVESVVTLV